MNAVFLHGVSGIWPSRLACGLCICLLASGVCAQTGFRAPANPVVLQSPDSQSSSAHRAVVQKNRRFLGWKFAALSEQDTKRWVRKSGQAQYLPAREFAHGLVQTQGS